MLHNAGTPQIQPQVGPTATTPNHVVRNPVRPKEGQKFQPRLPVELLRNIFEEYLRMDLPVQVLLEVCRKWRTVALETQSLWRRLLLSADAIPDSLRAGSVHACDSEERASLILKRSGEFTKLEVTLVLGPKEGDDPTPEQRVSLFKTVGHTALERISFLCVIVNPEMSLPLVTSSLEGVFMGKLPCLESLMIASAQAIGNLYEPLKALMGLIEDSSTRLKSLYLENVNKDFIVEASKKEYWLRLIRITIRNEFDSLDAAIFARPPNLEFFSFSGELIATPPPTVAHLDSSHKAPIEFPELKWLRVSLISMGTLARLRVPKLHTMAIDCVQGAYPAPAPAPGKLVIPSLKVLQIATVNPTIACINAPELDTLCLSIPALKQADADHVLKSVFYGGEGMMQPRHLTLRGPVHDKHLITALRLLGDKLVSLELDCQMPFSKTFWMEMTPGASARRAFKSVATSIASTVTGGGNVPAGGRKYKAPLLPNLRCLVVDVHKNPMAAGEGRDMRVLLSRFIEARRGNEAFKSLMRVACKWREGPGIEEMIDPPLCLSCAERAARA
ncbi:hypothetical protein M408DRAFT_26016 [Serendipita vermifera MAFF 305830]|uniref:F-box domain-containing protein n=1 Tax=Serendipita vermifera MAFF 305830 TaxID=933852 RepID=A0A0C3AM90_SERVB|nr:hypothetical protein M408DRAFT_26016 [Serendipita vermifera MAFF 305830]